MTGSPHTLQTNRWCGCSNDSEIGWSVGDVTLSGYHNHPTWIPPPRFVSVGLSEGPYLCKPPSDRPENKNHGKDQSYPKRGVCPRNWQFRAPHSGVPATGGHFEHIFQTTWTAEPKLSWPSCYKLSLIWMKNKANLSSVVEMTSTFMGCIHLGSPCRWVYA